MDLIRDISDIQRWAAVSVNFRPESLAPAAASARDKVTDILGSAEFFALSTAYGGATDTTTANQKMLLPFAQKALVLLALEEFFTTGLAEISNAGAHLSQSKDRRGLPADLRKEQQKRYRDNGYAALQQLLRFLHSSLPGQFPLWENSPEKAEHLSLFCNTASDFQQHYDIDQHFLLFLKLRPAIREVEQSYIEPILGPDLSLALREQIQVRQLTAADKRLLLRIRAALAPMAILHAIPKNADTFTTLGFLQHTTSHNYLPEMYLPSDKSIISLRIKDAERQGFKALHDLENFLQVNAESYPLYTPPVPPAQGLNSPDKKIFTIL
jgi:hypothetical protein